MRINEIANNIKIIRAGGKTIVQIILTKEGFDKFINDNAQIVKQVSQLKVMGKPVYQTKIFDDRVIVALTNPGKHGARSLSQYLSTMSAVYIFNPNMDDLF